MPATERIGTASSLAFRAHTGPFISPSVPMKRLVVLRWLIPLLIWLSAVPSRAVDSPNIIFLFADDQTFDSLGCYGNPDVRTPHIDRLASESLTFDHYYNTTAICMASRANIMTGMYEYKTGCNFGMGDLPRKHFDLSYPVLLRKAGYATAIAGKIGFTVEGIGLPEDAFDWWGAGPGQTHYETRKNKSMAGYAERYPHSTLSYGAFGSDFIEWAVGEKKPFCLSISFKAPHRPVTPDPRFDDVYSGITFRKPQNFGRENGLHFSEQSRRGRQYPRFISWGYRDNFNETLAKYHQQIYAIDQAVGMIREAVERAGVSGETVIVYTSDNGFFNGAHGYGSKVLPYEESSRAPMIFHHPGVPESHGRRTSTLSGNIDVAPTFLDLAGVPIPEKVDGRSLVPLLKNPEMKSRESLSLMNCWGPEPAQSFAVVTDRYKYIHWYFDDDTCDPGEEFYDLKEDRLEMTNLAAGEDHAEILDELRNLYDSAVEHIGKSAERKNYRKYAVLFDRHTPWDEKRALLPERLTPAGK